MALIMTVLDLLVDGLLGRLFWSNFISLSDNGPSILRLHQTCVENI